MFHFVSIFLLIISLGEAAVALTWECSILKNFIMFFNGDTLLILIINNIHTNKKKTRSGEMV